jgi:hypothetical protein
MSDAIGYAPTAPSSSRAAELAAGLATNVANAKGDAAPLKAFEAALLNVQAANPAPAQAAAQTASAPTANRAVERGTAGASSASGQQSQTTIAEAAGGPQPTARSASTATAAGVRANAETDVAAKLRQGQLGGAKSKLASKDTSTKSATHGEALPTGSGRTTSTTSAGTAAGTTDGSDDTAIVDGLAPTTALSSALTSGTAADVKAALQTTLQGFADGTVPEAIKAAISKSGSVAAQQSAVEIGGLLDSISTIAQDIVAKGPISDADFASAFDQLFWVSNWFDLFNAGSGTGSTANDPIYNSVNSAMAVPMDIFFTRAVMVPLVDTERVVSPGLVNRRAVRANTEAVPGSDTVDRPAV